MKLMQIIRSFFGLVYPKLCACCGDALSGNEDVLCLSCLYNMPRTHYWLDSDNPVAQLFWGRVNITHASALFFFGKGGRYRKLVHKLKYKNKRVIGVKLGELLGNELKKVPHYQLIETIVPVPLHPKKQHRRGYNQSEQIALGIAKATGWTIDTGTLIRTRFTETQTRKSRKERLENVTGVFRVQDFETLKNKQVLLVDDVVTTGATLEACAMELLNIEGCQVSVAALSCVK